MSSKGFTLLEFLIVITIIALSVSLIYPSFSVKFGNINTDKAVQDVILSLKTYRWKAFRKKEGCKLFVKGGHLWVKWEKSSPKQIEGLDEMKINMKKPWICLPNGAVTDADIEITKNGKQYKILVSAVEGKIGMEREKM